MIASHKRCILPIGIVSVKTYLQYKILHKEKDKSQNTVLPCYSHRGKLGLEN